MAPPLRKHGEYDGVWIRIAPELSPNHQVVAFFFVKIGVTHCWYLERKAAEQLTQDIFHIAAWPPLEPASQPAALPVWGPSEHPKKCQTCWTNLLTCLWNVQTIQLQLGTLCFAVSGWVCWKNLWVNFISILFQSFQRFKWFQRFQKLPEDN